MSFCRKISDAYFRIISSFVEFLLRRGWFTTGIVLGTLLSEPLQALKAGLFYPAGWKTHFNFYGLNPKNITEDQAEKRPLLLLHGNLHNQSAWLSFAQTLQRANLGPVYTLNLPNHEITPEDLRRINEKLAEIQEQYKTRGKENIEVDLVAHSRGAYLATYMALAEESRTLDSEGNFSVFPARLKKRKEIGKVICLGATVSDWYIRTVGLCDPIHEITGAQDLLSQGSSRLARQFIANVGHLGLLYSPAVQEKTIEWLRG